MMPLFLIALAVLFVAVMAYRAYQSVYAGGSVHNLNGPVVETKAKLLRKETHVSTRIDAGGAMVSDDVYQLSFALDTGGELSFSVGLKAYENTPKDEWGTLTYQGTRFLGFEYRSDA